MRSDVVWRGVAWAVTPVHVGAGETWTKQDYVVRDGKLCRIDPARVVARMDPVRRREFERAVDRGDLQGAHCILAEAVDADDILERIPLGPRARQELEQAQKDARRWGEVMPFIRTGGRPFIPGSSIKGAIRTALLNAVVQARGLGPAKQVIAGAGARTSDRLQEWAFGYDGRHTEQDPFRFVEVGDVPLPDGATRIDRVVNWNPKAEESQGIQMHVERLACRLEGTVRVPLTIRLDLGRLEAARRCDAGPGHRRTPSFPLTEAGIRKAVKAFYAARYRWERDRFFEEQARFLDSMFAVKIGNGTLSLDELLKRDDFLLLRVGRFTQFESKSVDDLRRGYAPQRRRTIPEGSTRNVMDVQLRTSQGKTVHRRLPFGWVLVWLREIRVQS